MVSINLDSTLAKRKKNKEEGPIADADGNPYDYIIIIDSGSTGSRAYVYNWLSPKGVYEKSIVKGKSGVNYNDNDSDSDSDDEQDGEERLDPMVRLPQISTNPDWNKKVKPGLSSYNSSPGKVGKDHIKKLLDGVAETIPKSQHERTPIFLHATAGMRLLKPNEQETLLNTVCKYIQRNYDFYLPDCASHINIIDGDVEGLYGWISLNYLMGAFDQPDMHNHGKNHSTYGLLDMGGASTQICFQPNSTEEAEHANALFKLELSSMKSYQPDLTYNVFSTSFLGLGMYKAHDTYLDKLRAESSSSSSPSDAKIEVVKDPCLPKDLVQEENFLIGSGNFTQCMDLIYPVLIEAETSDTQSCSVSDAQDISSCLLSNTIPSLDFDVDKFIGVSGYWDAISHMLGIDNISQYGNAYSYESFYMETQKICETPWSELDHYNDEEVKTSFGVLSDAELSELCFKSSWILNVLHRGLGFPKLPADSNNGKTDTSDDDKGKISPFQVAEAIHGSEFTWTLGRAVLYSVWENAKYQATLNHLESSEVQIGYSHASAPNLYTYGGEIKGIDGRPAYTGGLSNADKGHTDDDHDDHGHGHGHDDDHDDHDDDHDDDDDHWEIDDDFHKSYTPLFALIILSVILYFLLGPKKRQLIAKGMKRTFYKACQKLRIPIVGSKNYSRLSSGGAVELQEIGDNDRQNSRRTNNDIEEQIDESFGISDDE